MKIAFSGPASKDYYYWKKHDTGKYDRINKLCLDIIKNPFEGIGKPEPLKYDLQNMLSRRIDRTHRLIYKIHNKKFIIFSCRYHY